MYSEDNVLKCAVAIRGGQFETARTMLENLLPEDMPAKEYLREQRMLLSIAVRRNESALAQRLLLEHQERLTAALKDGELAEEAGEFLQVVVFGICDRRLADLREPVQKMVGAFAKRWRGKPVSTKFWSEWTVLAARIARRGWQEETAWLFNILFKELLRPGSEWRRVTLLLGLQQHFTLYCRWDGAEKALSVYGRLFDFYHLLVGRAVHGKYSADEQETALKTALRSFRDLVTTMARMQMVDELEVFTQWYDLLLAQASGSAAKQLRVRRLLQLTILYWQSTMPKTSRKQIKFLRELLEPDALGERYHSLLENVC